MVLEKCARVKLELLGKCKFFFFWRLQLFFCLLLISPPTFNIITDQVCLQETGEEENQEEERRDDGDHREADPTEDQLEIRRQPRLRLRDEGRALPR